MLYFLLATLALIVGYVVYGTFVAKVFGASDARPTPADTLADGVDYVKMPVWKIWLVQLLNIAGVGPVFGPILGALYGPAALLWIVIGTIFAGAVHDYMVGMISLRYGGANVPALVGYNLGRIGRQIMQVFSMVLLVLVGAVFVAAPADLLAKLVKPSMPFLNTPFWVILIYAYYFVATIMPVDKIIGRFYPFFGAIMLFMAIGVTVAMFASGTEFYNSAEWTNQHPKGLPLFPLMFITIACGAISGFHATQSPLMSRCLAKESMGRMAFYGGMVAEGFIALVWATVGMSFYHGPEALQAALAAGGPGNVVTEASIGLLGNVGGILAILGVVVLPITSGDTAFRAARLTLAEAFRYSQKAIDSRLLLAVPMFLGGVFLSQVGFNTLWFYFGWANQSLASLVLWCGAVYLIRRRRLHWICSLPATFMTAVCATYLCYEPKMGLALDIGMASILGVILALACLILFLVRGRHPADPSLGEPENA